MHCLCVKVSRFLQQRDNILAYGWSLQPGLIKAGDALHGFVPWSTYTAESQVEGHCLIYHESLNEGTDSCSADVHLVAVL